MVSDSLLVLVLNLVGNLAGRYQFLNLSLDGSGTLCDLLDNLQVAGVELLSLLGGKTTLIRSTLRSSWP